MQYYFIEYQRAKRALRVALILLGVLLLIAVIMRVSIHPGDWATTLQQSPTAHVTRTQLPDGSTRIVIDDPQRQTHAVVVKHPDGAVDVDATEPKSAGTHHDSVTIGSVQINEHDQGNLRRTTMRYRPMVPTYELGDLFLVALPMALIVASLLAGVLAKENDGHLELAWTKPVTRERYALAAFFIDGVTIVVTELLTIATVLLATLLFFVPRFQWPAETGWAIVMAIAAPIAWYTLITAASASLKRGPGAIVGLGWVAAVIVPSIAAIVHGAAQYNTIAAWFYAIFRGLSYLDPIAYLSFSGDRSLFLPLGVSAGLLCALTILYAAAAIVQWRRVEA